MESHDRHPPHSVEAEQGVLGCILWDPACLDECAAIGEGAFYDLRHWEIFKAARELRDEQIPVDMFTVQQRLNAVNKLEQVGNITYLSSLQDATPSAANLRIYLDVLTEKWTLRKAIRHCATFLDRAYECSADVGALIDEMERAALAVRVERVAISTGIKELVHSAIGEIEDRHKRNGIGGLTTGLIDLDNFTDGMHGGELIVLAAFPNVGKSALAMNIAEHVAIDLKKSVGVFSLEMSGVELIKRMIGARARVNLRGELCERDFQRMATASGNISHAGIYIEDGSDMTISQLRAMARRLNQKNKISLWVVDYLQLVTCPEAHAKGNREQEVAQVAVGLKQLAKEMDAPVIVLSQLNDDGKLRESRATGQHADAIWKLNRSEGGNMHGEAVCLHVEKQRSGPRGPVNLTFIPKWTRFECAAKISDQDMPHND